MEQWDSVCNILSADMVVCYQSQSSGCTHWPCGWWVTWCLLRPRLKGRPCWQSSGRRCRRYLPRPSGRSACCPERWGACRCWGPCERQCRTFSTARSRSRCQHCCSLCPEGGRGGGAGSQEGEKEYQKEDADSIKAQWKLNAVVSFSLLLSKWSSRAWLIIYEAESSVERTCLPRVAL